MDKASRPVWGTRKYRAEDIETGDVVRNKYGKWARVTKAATAGLYTTFTFDAAATDVTVRDVHLVDVQVARPS